MNALQSPRAKKKEIETEIAKGQMYISDDGEIKEYKLDYTDRFLFSLKKIIEEADNEEPAEAFNNELT